MPEKKTTQRARRDRRQGKSTSTQAGAFVREEIEHVREGKHGARSTKQAIAIGLSKARRAGVELEAPKKGTASRATRKRAKADLSKGRTAKKRPSPKRSRAAKRALKREPRRAASSRALARHAKKVVLRAVVTRRRHAKQKPAKHA